jgi:hypothetical protein
VARALNNRSRWIRGAWALVLLLTLVAAGSARAATYPPASGSTFTGSAEGWKTTKAECSVALPLGCSDTGEYSGTAGNPPGSLEAKGTILVNLIGAFKGETNFESPTFTVATGGQGTLNLQRAFTPSGGLALTATLNYSATLVDKTTGQQQKAITESVSGVSPFAAQSGAVSLVGGHSYAIVIESEVSANIVALSVGSSATDFDNVSVTGPESAGGGGGGNGVGGASGLTNSQLESLIKSSLTGSATLKGGKLYVKAKCPAKVGVACKVTVQGLLKKGKPATAPRTAKIAKGKSKQLVLKVKPKQRSVVAKRKNLLFKETVKAAKAKATVYKRLKLIRH